MPLDVVDQLPLLGELLVADVADEGHVAVGLLLVSLQVGDRVVLQRRVVRAQGAGEDAAHGGGAGARAAGAAGAGLRLSRLVTQQVLVVSSFALEPADAFGALKTRNICFKEYGGFFLNWGENWEKAASTTYTGFVAFWTRNST